MRFRTRQSAGLVAPANASSIARHNVAAEAALALLICTLERLYLILLRQDLEGKVRTLAHLIDLLIHKQL